ncbi:hypothetical protein [Mesorhizobium sp.]|uniref:hypothetical protein n=1 Tax=Mesorhizobium sp. TaxID=1871066 RepID=UPI001221EBD7|nr:hypothetical protein [Mesorhizobium sp.]TIS37509.1 MAG: hypothetical protein E5W95_18015 [Mesorhizobium sp.]
MSTPFADLETLVSAEVDALMGEPTRVVRKVPGQYFSRSADGSRADVDVIGVVDYNPVMARPKDQGQYDGFQPGVAGDRIHVSYTDSRFADRAAWPADGDEIWLLDPARLGVKLRVTRADADELGRVVCICVPA